MLTVIMGGMFSEKTTELIRRGRRAKRAGKRVVYVKPSTDTRYSAEKIVSHDGLEVDSIVIGKENPIDIQTLYDNYDVICIDEVQFISSEVVGLLNTLAVERHVIVAGLDMTYNGDIFDTTMKLAAYAEEVVKLHAVCSECGDDSWISQRLTDSQEIVELGSDNEYRPMCRKCFVKNYLQNKENEQ